MTIVDIHPHIVSNNYDKFPISPIGGQRSDWSNERSVNAEQMIEAMDAAGVDKAAMVHSSTTYGFSCEYVADAVAHYPDRFTGVFSINVLEPDNVAMMQKWFDLGCTGMRIFSRGSTLKGSWLAIDDPRIFPCYEFAADNGISIASNITVENFDQLENVLKKFPMTKMVLDHLGKTDFTDGTPFDNAKPLFSLAKYPNLHMKLVTRNFQESNNGKSTTETMIRKLVSVFGADRIAWGSNYPASKGSLADLLTLAREGVSFLPSADQDLILGGTALSLYPALARSEAVRA